jgi:hypothetical protein
MSFVLVTFQILSHRGHGKPELRGTPKEKALFAGPLAVGDPGLEPGTSALSERRSNQLS